MSELYNLDENCLFFSTLNCMIGKYFYLIFIDRFAKILQYKGLLSFTNK